ncbi:MAG: HEPN domain-containing protein [Rhizobiaceae bacterium]|nr:HEPN domain-containing protein [Rhizobiaceae bacterium]
MIDDEARRFIGEWMELIDKLLAAKQIPAANRVLISCNIFVREAIVGFGSGEEAIEPSEELLTKFLLSESFREFYVEISDWYTNRYGADRLYGGEWALNCVVPFAGEFMEIQIPVLRVIEKTPWMAKVQFASHVHDDENIFGWVKSPPNWEAFSTDDQTKFERDARAICSARRKVKAELLTTSHPTDDANEFRSAIVSHSSAAARLIQLRENLGGAYWECHMAVEKMLKLLLIQNGLEYPRSHDLDLLINKLAIAENIKFISKLLSASEAVSYRYGNTGQTTWLQLWELYKTATLGLAELTDHLKCEVRLADTVMNWNRPDFFPLPIDVPQPN